MMEGELQRAVVPVANEELADWRIRGDPEADELVEALKVREGIDWLENRLPELFRWHPDMCLLNKDLDGFLRAPHELPAWLQNWQRVARGQALYAKFRRTGLLILGCASLPQCYAHSEVAGTLIMSGRLASQVRTRIGETGNFLDAVMQQGALQNGDGLLWIRKVRLIHAVMRALILQDPQPYADRTDGRVSDVLLKRRWPHFDRRPIDQVEMAFVLLTFSLIVVRGWRSLGIRLSARQRDDYLYAWAVIGHMLGVHERMLCRCMTFADAESLFEAISALQQGAQVSPEAVEAGRLLAAALLVLLKERVASRLRSPWLPRWALRTLPHSMIRHLGGGKLAQALDVDPAPVLARFLHAGMIAWQELGKGTMGRLGVRPTENDLCAGFGEGIHQEFCRHGPHLRAPRP